MFIESVMLSSHLILWCPRLLLPSIFSSIRDFANELVVHIRWPKYWSFRCSISPFSVYSGLIFIKIDWFGLLAVQGTFRSLLQSTVQRYEFFGILPSLWYSSHNVTTGKTIALIIRTFVGRLMSLLFNMLSGLVIDFLPRNKHLLISWLQAPSAVILEAKKRKSVTTSVFSLSACHEVMGLDAMILVL